ncbi:hypothetical protein G7084_01495 [Weissella coleopterorum]|uniref:Uncharacterized protein n=1 Tax=Weissella coleopterorum TaxID=2714949 RepID=A0A6G8AYQ2_9LACO|nr:hypothetical protein [Weissella coleopterorum]QIL50110.1 hypothetical protein G7084_01495 [Weissella coleopterorum]
MDIGFSTTVEKNFDFDEIITRLKTVDGQKVEAGIFGSFAQDKAMWNEYGTSRGIPARPFLRNSQYEHEAEWSQQVGRDMVNVFRGSISGQSVGVKLGKKMADDIKSTIDSGNFASLALSTIRHKGSSRPLIDTGDMRGSITHKEH